ncbi:hypothetical protein [Atopococcus tabaci]|uniref:hypothetical protein n=1 Tax=Atopococcus tabaci TaxID=269774 RepID=UPI0004048AA3|nr:hypothetical protein [Atopococcus tabaci]
MNFDFFDILAYDYKLDKQEVQSKYAKFLCEKEGVEYSPLLELELDGLGMEEVREKIMNEKQEDSDTNPDNDQAPQSEEPGALGRELAQRLKVNPAKSHYFDN